MLESKHSTSDPSQQQTVLNLVCDEMRQPQINALVSPELPAHRTEGNNKPAEEASSFPSDAPSEYSGLFLSTRVLQSATSQQRRSVIRRRPGGSEGEKFILEQQ